MHLAFVYLFIEPRVISEGEFQDITGKGGHRLTVLACWNTDIFIAFEFLREAQIALCFIYRKILIKNELRKLTVFDPYDQLTVLLITGRRQTVMRVSA